MAIHETTCPGCGVALLINVLPHIGGTVEENIDVQLVSPAPEAVIEPTPEPPVEEPAEVPPVA